MHEILRGLPAGARVLDLAAQHGSFPAGEYPVRTIRMDLDAPPLSGGAMAVRADAARLPFEDGAFDAVICNHGLEHFRRLDAVVREMARVLRPDGALFVSTPDAGTLTDRLYRFFASGGGHVNAFRSPEEVTRLFEGFAGLPARCRRTLFTSLSFLHPANRGARRNRRFRLLAGAGEGTLRWAVWLFRRWDRAFGTRLSVYGWSFYFGEIPEAPSEEPWTNVCIRCGSGHSPGGLGVTGRPPAYNCPGCGTRNFFTRDEDYRNVV